MNDYFSLSSDTQAALLRMGEEQLNLSSIAIEKDIWVCWILKQLFTHPHKDGI